jgi:hypothetical protein
MTLQLTQLTPREQKMNTNWSGFSMQSKMFNNFIMGDNKPKDLVAEWIARKTIKENSNFIGTWLGRPGCGKSYGALRFCETISRLTNQQFSVKDNVVFGIDPFIAKVVELNDRREKGEVINGTCILYDEAGVSMDNRQWWDKTHKSMNDVMETFRHLNLVVMITVPARDNLDKKLKYLAHGSFQPIKKSEGYSIVKFIEYNNNPLFDIEMKTYLKVRHHNWTVKIKTIKVPLPSLKLRNDYEKAQREFKGNLGINSLANIRKVKQVEPDLKLVRPLTKRQNQIYLLKRSGAMDEDIAVQLAISVGSVKNHVQVCKAKGWLENTRG